MKDFSKYLLYSLGSFVILTFAMGISDSAFAKMYESQNFINKLIGSFKYYLFWVLPYWWFIILIGAFVVAIILFGIMRLKRKIKS
jgi:hypothetical protein